MIKGKMQLGKKQLLHSKLLDKPEQKEANIEPVFKTGLSHMVLLSLSQTKQPFIDNSVSIYYAKLLPCLSLPFCKLESPNP